MKISPNPRNDVALLPSSGRGAKESRAVDNLLQEGLGQSLGSDPVNHC